MQTISQIYDDFLNRRDREWVLKAEIDGVEYGTDTIVDFSIDRPLVGGQEFEIGTANISKLTIRLRTQDEIPPNAKIVPYVGLSLASMTWDEAAYSWDEADWPWNGSGMTEWLSLGEFYVDNREQVNDIWVFECLDKLVWADVPFVSTLTYPTTMQAVWDEVCDRVGFTYDSSVVIDPSYQIQAGPAGYTCRQVMAYIAGANSASVYVGRDGVIKFKRYSASETPVFDMTPSEYIRLEQTNPTKTYTRIVAVYNTEEGLFYEAGEGDENHTLYLENPFVTQEMVDDLLANLNGFSYVPIRMDARGYPQLDAGDVLQFDRQESDTWDTAGYTWDEADIAWDGLVPYQSIILNEKFDFKGGLRMGIESPSKSEQESEFEVEGSLTQAINNLNRDALKLGKSYYGLTITRTEGLIIEREDHKSKLTLNSDVMDWQVDGLSTLYYDAQANRIKFTGTLEGADGIFSGTLQAVDGVFTGTLQGVDGEFSGTIEASEIIGSEIDGGVITGALIQTSASNYPRIELSSSNEVLRAMGDLNSLLSIDASFSGNPTLYFEENGYQAFINMAGTDLFIATPSGQGEIQIASGDDLRLNAQNDIILNSDVDIRGAMTTQLDALFLDDVEIRGVLDLDDAFRLHDVGSIGYDASGDPDPSGYSEGDMVWGTSRHGEAPHYMKNNKWYALTALEV